MPKKRITEQLENCQQNKIGMSSSTSQHEIYDIIIHLLDEWTGEIATSPTLTDETSKLTAAVSNEIVTKLGAKSVMMPRMT